MSDKPIRNPAFPHDWGIGSPPKPEPITETTAQELIAALNDLNTTMQLDIYERRKARHAMERNGLPVSGEQAAALACAGMSADEPA